MDWAWQRARDSIHALLVWIAAYILAAVPCACRLSQSPFDTMEGSWPMADSRTAGLHLDRQRDSPHVLRARRGTYHNQLECDREQFHFYRLLGRRFSGCRNRGSARGRHFISCGRVGTIASPVLALGCGMPSIRSVAVPLVLLATVLLIPWRGPSPVL